MVELNKTSLPAEDLKAQIEFLRRSTLVGSDTLGNEPELEFLNAALTAAIRDPEALSQLVGELQPLKVAGGLFNASAPPLEACHENTTPLIQMRLLAQAQTGDEAALEELAYFCAGNEDVEYTIGFASLLNKEETGKKVLALLAEQSGLNPQLSSHLAELGYAAKPTPEPVAPKPPTQAPKTDLSPEKMAQATPVGPASPQGGASSLEEGALGNSDAPTGSTQAPAAAKTPVSPPPPAGTYSLSKTMEGLIADVVEDYVKGTPYTSFPFLDFTALAKRLTELSFGSVQEFRTQAKFALLAQALEDLTGAFYAGPAHEAAGVVDRVVATIQATPGGIVTREERDTAPTLSGPMGAQVLQAATVYAADERGPLLSTPALYASTAHIPPARSLAPIDAIRGMSGSPLLGFGPSVLTPESLAGNPILASAAAIMGARQAYPPQDFSLALSSGGKHSGSHVYGIVESKSSTKQGSGNGRQQEKNPQGEVLVNNDPAKVEDSAGQHSVAV